MNWYSKLSWVFTFLISILIGFSAFAQNNSDFAFDLYHSLVKQHENIFFSPFSISSALTMTAAGAKGNTFKEMSKVLHLSKDPQLFYLGLLPQLKSKDYDFLIANRLWGKQGADFNKDFLQKLKDHYSADLTPLDFSAKPEESRATINKWVEEKTNFKIKEIMPVNSINALTELVITNALYFKGVWAEAFNKALTRTDSFFETATEKKQTSFMNKLNHFYVAENKKAQLIEIPYKGLELSFVIILPKDKNGLSDFEKTWNYQDLDKLYKSGESKEVHLSIPKFIAEGSFELNENLKQLGMVQAFDEHHADFDGIRKAKTEADKLYISTVAHKSFIEIDEVGTEATAATEVSMAKGGGMPEPVLEFKADHPFIYLIRHQASGAILFMGRYAKVPNATVK
jgi:serpin B